MVDSFDEIPRFGREYRKNRKVYRNKTMRKSRSHRLIRSQRRKLLAPLDRGIRYDVKMEPEENAASSTYINDYRAPLPLHFYIVPFSRKSKLESKKLKKKVSWLDEYREWYECSPNSFYYSMDKQNEVSEKITEILSYEQLPELDIKLLNDFENLFGSLAGMCRQVNGIYPPVQIIDANPSISKIISDEIDGLKKFEGYIIIFSIKKEDGTDSIRVLLNERNANNDSSSSSKKKIMLRIRNATHLLDQYAIDCKSIEPYAAEVIALQSVQIKSLKTKGGQKFHHLLSDMCECIVCDNQSSNGFALICGHYACRTCWLYHVVNRIEIGIVPIKCIMFNCDEELNNEHLLTFVPLSVCDRYNLIVCNKEFMKPTWIHCTNCPKLLNLPDITSRYDIVGCSCGEYICVKCKDITHHPLTCSEARLYNSIVEANGSFRVNDKLSSVQVKQCPICATFCEHGGGCNLMACICGAGFCYLCGKYWDENHRTCKSIGYQEIDLVDVPARSSNRLPIKVFSKCLMYRRNRHNKVLHQLNINLRRFFDKDDIRVNSVIQTFFTANQLLEMSTLKIFLLKRVQRDRHRYGVTIRAGWLNICSDMISFYISQLLMAANSRSTKKERINEIACSLERSLREYLSQIM